MAQIEVMAARGRLTAVLAGGDHRVRIVRPPLDTAPTGWSVITNVAERVRRRRFCCAEGRLLRCHQRTIAQALQWPVALCPA